MEVFVQFPSSHRPTLRFSFADRRHGPIGGLLSTVQVPALRCRPGAALLPPQQILGLRGGEGLARCGRGLGEWCGAWIESRFEVSKDSL